MCRVKCLRFMHVLIRIYIFPYLETFSHGGLVSSFSHALKKSDPVSKIIFLTPPWYTQCPIWHLVTSAPMRISVNTLSTCTVARFGPTTQIFGLANNKSVQFSKQLPEAFGTTRHWFTGMVHFFISIFVFVLCPHLVFTIFPTLGSPTPSLQAEHPAHTPPSMPGLSHPLLPPCITTTYVILRDVPGS